MSLARTFVATAVMLASAVSVGAAEKEVVKVQRVREIYGLEHRQGGIAEIVCIDGYKFIYLSEGPSTAPGTALVQFFERVKDKQGNEKMLPATCK